MRGSTAGLAEMTFERRNTFHDALLTFLDMAFASIIVTPAILIHWRGTWNLWKMYIFPDDLLYSGMTFIGIGTIGQFIIIYSQNILDRTFHPDRHRLTFMVVSRLYTYIYSIIGIAGWLGIWDLWDVYCPPDILLLCAFTAIGILLLAIFKGLRNISSPPFGISTDNSKDYFLISTMFKLSPSKEPVYFFLDCAFSVIVIGNLVVLVWRSLWVLFDLIIITEDPSMSAWYSVVIGYGNVAITFALQPVMKWACDRLTGFWRVAVCDAFLFFSFVGTVNVWRGVWELLDLHFMPDDPLKSNLITHFGGFILLALLNCSNSLLVRGVFIDAEEPAGQCVIFPVYYVRLFFQKERTKKRQRMLEALEKGDLTKELLEKMEKHPPQIVKSSTKSAEMRAMVNNRMIIENGFEKEKFLNDSGDDKVEK